MNSIFKLVRHIRILAFAFALVQGTSLFAQLDPPQPKFHNYTVDDGLPGSETYFVHQDRKGYIWICTDRGVSRFDGYKFQNFTMADGLSDNVVFRVYEDYKGRIWFITFNSMLSYYEDGKIKPYKYNYLIEQNLRQLVCNYKDISIDKNDKMYVSLNYNGIFSIDKNGAYKKYDTYDAITIKRFGGKMMWGIDNFTYEHSEMSHMDIKYFGDSRNMMIPHVSSGARWTLTNVGDEYFFLVDDNLFSLETGKMVWTEAHSIAVSANLENTWIGTFKNGVLQIPDIKHPEKSFRYLQGLSVTSVLKDNEGGYWFSTLENGVFYTPTLAIKNYTVQEGLIDNDVGNIGGINDEIYIGYLVEMWQGSHRAGSLTPLGTGKTGAKFGGSSTSLYASFGAIYAMNNGKVGKRLDTFWASDFYDEKTGSVLMGSQNIFRVYENGKRETVYDYEMDKGAGRKNLFHCFMSSSDRRLWAGCISGLRYVENGQMSTKGLDDSLFKVRVVDLASHPKWKNIAATRGAGIYFFNNQKKIFKQLTMKDGLLSDLANVLLIDDDGGIWLGTNKGLNHITQDSKGKIKIEAFTTLHGLCSNEISCLYAHDGKIYAGTKRGISVIDTRSFVRNKRFSGIFVTSMETDDKKLNPYVHNLLDYKEKYLKVTFRNINYKMLDKIFQYRFDSTSAWITVTAPEISMISPFPGEYDLQVRYLNEDGAWSPPESICQFTVDDAFYNKWYFFVCITILLGLTAWLVFKYRIRQLKQRHTLNNKISQLEQKALQAQMNPHFIFNALNSIQSFLVYEENEKAEKYLLKFAQLIRQTLNNSREQYITIESEIKTLEKYLELEQMRFKNKFTYTITTKFSPFEMTMKIPNMLVQPFVENAVIHGFSSMESGGRISVSMEIVDKGQVLCIVEDNGVGRKKTMVQSGKHLSHGVNITEERLKAFETRHAASFRIKTIDIENEDGTTGTRVLINVPLIESNPFEDQ